MTNIKSQAPAFADAASRRPKSKKIPMVKIQNFQTQLSPFGKGGLRGISRTNASL